ncbi:DUF4347 domain-containing protein [Rhodopirellula sp. MGV]|uniref:DUF4347 domain-containing protein n=1 Tax=Rhodopirellula sp. MGV TaxID=2023130 RepID=UPI0013044ABF|nr:DUF4347 domain-containing protein [Rhodopirellula sp. MGV]
MFWSRKQSPILHRATTLDVAELSPRLLFSATPVAPAVVDDPTAGIEVVVTEPTTIDTSDSNGTSAAPDTSSADSQTQSDAAAEKQRLELVFVDASVDDYQTLLADIGTSDATTELQIYLLDPSRDGVEQISEILEGYQDVDAVHLLSHGNDGKLILGDSVLDQYSLDGYAGQLASWRSALSEQADLLIYGCELAETESGRTMLEAIAELTGADLAASTDDTGAASLGGDWDLEYVIGQTETHGLSTRFANASWAGLLATPEIDSTGELRVYSSSGQDQELQTPHQSVAVDGYGNSVVVWVDKNPSNNGSDIFFQRFDADGNFLGARTRISANDVGDQSDPVVTMDTSGRFAIAWVSADSDGTGIFVRRFDASGNATDINDIKVNTFQESGNQHGVSIASNDNNQIVIAWESDGPSEGIYARTFDFTSTPTLDQIATSLVTIDSDADATNVAVDINQAGRYAVVWNDSSDMWGTRYDFGSMSAVEAKRNLDAGLGVRHQAVVSMLSNNDYVIAYRSEALLSQGVWLRVIPDSGALPTPVQVTSNSNAELPSISSDASNRIVVAYQRPDGDGTGIYFQAFSSSGSKIGTEQSVSISTTGDQENASVAIHDVNNVVVVWSGEGDQTSNSDSQGVFLRQFGNLNHDPTADLSAGAPYTIAEGDSLTVNGSNSTDSDGDTLTYAWDLDNDGVFGETGEPTTAIATISWATLQSFGIDDDGTYTIGLQVDDGKGGVATQTATVTVNNTAPVVTATGASSVLQGNAYTLNLSAVDPGDDTVSSWRVDWGDGTITVYSGASTTVTHTYAVEGLTHNILVSATDEDGLWYQGDVFVGGEASNPITRYDALTGTFETSFGGMVSLDRATDMVIGKDGLLYVSGWGSDNVQRFNPNTGGWVDEFVASGSGGLNNSAGLAFGRDGNLYVADYDNDSVLRFDASTGNFIDVFVASGAGGLDGATDIWFGSDGNLYVVGNKSDNILRFDGLTGAYIDEFVSAGSGGLDKPISATIGGDGRLYVSSNNNDEVLRFDATTGAFVDTFVTSGSGGLNKPWMLTFGPDGNLYVTSQDSDSVLRYDATGSFLDSFSSGMNNPRSIVFSPVAQVTVISSNTAPTATNTTQTINYNEDDSTVAIGDIVVSDADAGDQITAKLTINLPATGSLTTGTYGSTSSTYDSSTGVWQITGSVAEVNAALADVSFSPTADNDQDSQITVHIEDSTADGPADGLIQLNVTAINDAPELDLDADDSSTATGGDYLTSFLEAGGSVLITDASDALVSDVDNSTLSSITVTITNPSDGALETLAADTTGTSISANYAAGVLTLSGTDSVANYQQVLRTVRYNNTSSTPTTTNRLVTFVANDGTADSGAVTSTIQIGAVNDAPAITVPGAQTANEDTVLNITGISVSDADLGSGIIEVTFSVSNGKLRINPLVASGVTATEVSGNNSSTVVVRSTLSQLNTTLSSTGINYVGASNYNGSDLLQITADDSVSTTTENVAINVQPVNDPPVAVNDRFQTTQNSVLTVNGNGVLQNDFDLEGNSLSVVLIDGPASGSLQFNSNGSFTYQPSNTTSGLITFTYAAFDGTSQSSPATVQIFVSLPILPPTLPSADAAVVGAEPPSSDTALEPPQDSSADQPAPITLVTTPAVTTGTPTTNSTPQIVESKDDGSSNDLSSETVLVSSDDAGEVDEYSGADHGGDYVARRRLAIRNSSISMAASAWGEFDSKIVWDDLDKVQQQINQPTDATFVMAGSFAGFSSALSVGYVVWTVRGGLLATSLLAHLPAWSFVDPLLVLSDLEGQEDESDDDSLENIIDKKQAERDAEQGSDESAEAGGVHE